MASVFNTILNWGKEHAPELLVGAGIVSGVATVVLACVETTKAGDILDKHNAEMKKIDEAKAIAAEREDVEYTEKDIKKDRMIVVRDTAVSMAKLYWPAALCGATSIVCTLAGHNILAKRYGAATAALTVTQGLFSKYRSRVIEDQGVEKDQQYLLGSKIVKDAKEEEIIDPETGEVTKVKKDAEVIDIDVDLQTGPIRIFAEYNPDGSKNYEWDPNIDMCIDSLRFKQNYFNDVFRARGFIFLNEVFKTCGLNQTKAGQFLGWKYEEGKSIDFGLFENDGITYKPQVRKFINGETDFLVLYFNVDGMYDPTKGNFIDGQLIEAAPILDALEA